MRYPFLFLIAHVAALVVSLGSDAAGTESSPSPLHITTRHPWCAPFGLDGVGQPTRVVVEPSTWAADGERFVLVGQCGKHEVLRETLAPSAQFPLARDISPEIDRVALLAVKDEAWREIGAQPVAREALEAEAEARLDSAVNPVDMGTVFPPANWLVLAPGQRALIHLAAFHRTADVPDARVVSWFGTSPRKTVETPLPLIRGRRSEIVTTPPKASFDTTADTLEVSIQDHDGAELWHKKINVMLVGQAPQWPRFGATETKLRYPLPISVRDPKTGTLSTLPYEQGWDAALNDVVVSLPNGSRFVFWRGSSYVPFWAGAHNTGLSYEWAETGPLPEGFVDCVEPLMDKELRYSRVRIIESTPARVHVRWTYQSCDFNYKVWGDAPQEDFYFYPDGFGTRVLTLKSAPDSDYEVSEFIILAPPEGYPFDLLPANPIRCLALDGTAMTVPIPFTADKCPASPVRPLVYRVAFARNQPETAVYFNPSDGFPVEDLTLFRPFYDGDIMVTPAYWGSHWPLSRGNTTGGAIDDRIHISPSHNSLMSWARHRPDPVFTQTGPSLDTLGHAREMRTQRWVWLIGNTAEPDGQLVARARSFSEPAALEVQGAELGVDACVMERRVYHLNVTADKIIITVKPNGTCVNPVFELENVPKRPLTVMLSDRELREDEYAWDGKILWLNATISHPEKLTVESRV